MNQLETPQRGAIQVGKPDTKPSAPSHTRGVAEGNEGRGGARRAGPRPVCAAADRSTGIRPEARLPIDPRMPNLTPA